MALEYAVSFWIGSSKIVLYVTTLGTTPVEYVKHERPGGSALRTRAGYFYALISIGLSLNPELVARVLTGAV